MQMQSIINYFTIILLLCLAQPCMAQPAELNSVFQPEDLQEDFILFQRILEQAHGNLYTYNDTIEIKRELSKTYSALDRSMSYPEFYKLLNGALCFINNQQTTVSYPSEYLKQLYKLETFFPLHLRLISQKMYCDDRLSVIPVGSEILSINGKRFRDIYFDALTVIPTEGKNKTYAYQELERAFPFYYTQLYGPIKEYEISFTDPVEGGNKTITMAAVSYNEFLQRQNKKQPQKNAKPFSYTYIDSIRTAVLTINEVEKKNNKRLKKFLKNNFARLKEKKGQYLILDLRKHGSQNEAIYPLIFSYLSQRSYKEVNDAQTVGLRIPFKELLTGKIKRQTRAAEKMLIQKFVEEDSGYFTLNPNMNPVFISENDAFTGNLYVLISGNTLNSGVGLCSLLRNENKATFIGEETGGNYYGHSGGVMLTYKLPKTGMILRVPKIHFIHYVQNNYFSEDSGIIPHYTAVITPGNIIENSDPVMDFNIKLIRLGNVR